MPRPLTPEQIDKLRQFSTPTISNAVETFDVRPRNTGFLPPGFTCFFPELGPMVGYSATAVIQADQPALEGHCLPVPEYWDTIQTVPLPRVMVIHDLDRPRPVGSFWGEVNANIHRALGCVGVVTNGGVRDLEEVRALSFHFFAAEVLASHAYVHVVDAGGPVRVGGVLIRPGDLLHADQHGAVIIPEEIADRVADAARKVELGERPIIDLCRSPDFSAAKLKQLWKEIRGTT